MLAEAANDISFDSEDVAWPDYRRINIGMWSGSAGRDVVYLMLHRAYVHDLIPDSVRLPFKARSVVSTFGNVLMLHNSQSRKQHM